jgi:hypothetical protein
MGNNARPRERTAGDDVRVPRALPDPSLRLLQFPHLPATAHHAALHPAAMLVGRIFPLDLLVGLHLD